MRVAAREEKRKKEKSVFLVPLLSHAFHHTGGHLRVSHILLDGPRKRETATADSLLYMKLSQGLITYNACKCYCCSLKGNFESTVDTQVTY